MPPKEELFKPFASVFKFKFKGETVSIEWKSAKGGLIFRPHGADKELLWFVPEFWFLEEPWHPTELTQNRKGMAWTYEYEQFFRLVPIENDDMPAESWFVLRPDASGVSCQKYKQWANWKADLFWEEGNSKFLHAPLRQIQGITERAIESNTREWLRACEWAQQDEETRFWSIVNWQHGDAQEWKLLMHAAMQIASLADEKEKHDWGIFVLEKPRFQFARLEMGRGRNNHPTPKRLAPLLTTLENYFRPRIDYSRSGSRWKPPFYSLLRPSRIRGSKPGSYHELMEAIELWRDFGRKSGQLPQVEACLRELLT